MCRDHNIDPSVKKCIIKYHRDVDGIRYIIPVIIIKEAVSEKFTLDADVNIDMVISADSIYYPGVPEYLGVLKKRYPGLPIFAFYNIYTKYSMG